MSKGIKFPFFILVKKSFEKQWFNLVFQQNLTLIQFLTPAINDQKIIIHN